MEIIYSQQDKMAQFSSLKFLSNILHSKINHLRQFNRQMILKIKKELRRKQSINLKLWTPNLRI